VTYETSALSKLDSIQDVVSSIVFCWLFWLQIANDRTAAELLLITALSAYVLYIEWLLASTPSRWILKSVSHVSGPAVLCYTSYCGPICEEETAAVKPDITTDR